MKLTKDEFKVLVMLYLANVDGEIHSEEIKVMLRKTDCVTVNRIEKLFSEMSDFEIVDCIRENKEAYANTEKSRLELIADMIAIMEADEVYTAMEERALRDLEMVLTQ